MEVLPAVVIPQKCAQIQSAAFSDDAASDRAIELLFLQNTVTCDEVRVVYVSKELDFPERTPKGHRVRIKRCQDGAPRYLLLDRLW